MHVRRLAAGEGERIRELRLRALGDAPHAFVSSLAEEQAEPAEHWDDLASRSDRAQDDVVFVAEEGGALVGMAGGYLADAEPGAAGLWARPLPRP